MIKRNHKIVATILSFLGLVLLGAYLLPQVVVRLDRGPHRRTACQANLKQIGLALAMYADISEGRLPPGKSIEGLNRLRRASRLDSKIFICPVDKIRHVAKPDMQLAEENCSYVFAGGLWQSENETNLVPLCWDKTGNHGGAGLNVLFDDGHVMWMTLDAWERIHPDK